MRNTQLLISKLEECQTPRKLLKFNSYSPFSQTFEQSCQHDRFLWPFNLLPGFTEKRRKSSSLREKRQKFRDWACFWRIVLSDRSIHLHFFHMIQYSTSFSPPNKLNWFPSLTNGAMADQVWMFSDNLELWWSWDNLEVMIRKRVLASSWLPCISFFSMHYFLFRVGNSRISKLSSRSAAQND